MRELIFVSPKAREMADQVIATIGDGKARIGVLGDTPLAMDLRRILAEQDRSCAGVESLQGLIVSGSSLQDGPQILVLTETDGVRLGEELHICRGWKDGTIIAPCTDHCHSKRPLFLISIPKSGTHMVHDLMRQMGFRAGVEMPAFPQGKTWYCLEYSNSHTVARDFFVDSVKTAPFGNRHHAFMWSPSLFIYRHPLDILVSEAHYYGEDGKTTFAGWFSGTSFEERIEMLLSDNQVIGSFSKRIAAFLPWLQFPNVISFSFEELVGGNGGGSDVIQEQLVWSLLLKLQAPGVPTEIAAKVFNPGSPTFRSGQIGGYRSCLSEGLVERFVAENKEMLQAFGYAVDGSFGFSEKTRERLQKSLCFSEVDSYNTAIYLEKDFLGCDLVRYRGQLYGVPRSAGPLTLLGTQQLRRLPSETSLANLKLLLMFGDERVAERRRILEQLGADIGA